MGLAEIRPFSEFICLGSEMHHLRGAGCWPIAAAVWSGTAVCAGKAGNHSISGVV